MEKYELVIPEKIYIINNLEEAKVLIKKYNLNGFTLRLIKDEDENPIIRNPTDPATDKQLSYLKDLGVEVTNITKEEAKQLIKEKLSQQTKPKSLEDESISRREEPTNNVGETFEKDKPADNNFPDY